MFKPTLIKLLAILGAVTLGLGSFGSALADEGKDTAITPPLFFGLSAASGTIGAIDLLNQSFLFSTNDGRLFTVTTNTDTVIANRLLGSMTFSGLRIGDRALIFGAMSGNMIIAKKIITGAATSLLANNDFRFRFRDEIRQDPNRLEFRIRQDAPALFNNARFFPNRMFFNNNLGDLRAREEFRLDPDRAELRIRQDRDFDNRLPDLENRLRFEAKTDGDNEDRN